MPRILPILAAIVIAASTLAAQTPTAATPHHESNFDSERKQADELFTAQKYLDSLPLYEDLCRQDPTIAVFAERYGTDLSNKAGTLSDPAEQAKVHAQAMAEFLRAKKLGDDSPYLRVVLADESKTFLGALFSGVPLTVGWTYQGKPEAQAAMHEAEAAFGRADLTGAVKLYEQAAALDPAWYPAALYAGDSYFKLKDTSNAVLWYARAVAIDPDRETGYRYWGDALMQAGDGQGAREKFVQAVVAEPYGKPPMIRLESWAKQTGHQIVAPAITRPEFTTPNGVLKIDPELAASAADGRSSWILYQQYRVAHGARTLSQFIVAGGSNANGVVTPSGYRHTIAEEHAALRAMLADIETNLKTGTLAEASLDPSIRNLRLLEHGNVLGAWIAINAADAGIRSDYPEYRAKHRDHLVEYVNSYLIR